MSEGIQRSALPLDIPPTSSNLSSVRTGTYPQFLASPYDNGVMVYMSYLKKKDLQIFKQVLMNEQYLPDTLGTTWEQLDRASWAEMVHLLIEIFPGVLAWRVALEILNSMNKKKICSLVEKELKDILPTLEPMCLHLGRTPLSLTREDCDQIQAYRQHVVKNNFPEWDKTIWPGNQMDFLYKEVKKHNAILPCLFLPRSPQGRQPNTVVIHGIPGIGKTTLARKIMGMWAHNEFYAHKFKYAFYFHCRELSWVGEHSFSEWIESQGLRSQALASKILSRPDQLLLLFDGFEEFMCSLITKPIGLTEDWNQKLPGSLLLSSLLSKTMLPEATLLIMVRPASWKSIKLLVKDPIHVTLTGFSRTETLNYFRLYFHRKRMGDEAVDFAMKNAILLSTCRVPVICWMVCYCLSRQMEETVDLTKACPNATSVFVLYLATLFHTIFKELSSRDYQKQLEGVCHLAAYGIWYQKSVFNKTEFQYVMVEEATIDTFLQVNILQKLEGQRDHYVFTLFIFQEILGALFHILCYAQRDMYYHWLSHRDIQDLIILSRERETYQSQMGLFFFGLLNDECTKIVLRSFKCELFLGNKLKVVKVINYLNSNQCYETSQLFHCLTETREENFAISSLVGYQKVSLKIKSQEDLEAAAFCLKHCRDLKKVELTLSRDFYKDLGSSAVDLSYGSQMKEDEILFHWWRDVCSVFETSENLEVLAVSNSVMKDPVMKILATALKKPQCKLQRLQQLRVEHTKLGEEAMKALCDAGIPQCLLQCVRLEHCEATPRDWVHLISDLQRSTQLKTLLLRANFLGIFGVNYLSMNHLRELALENCNLTEVSCEGIAFSLRHSQVLTHLSLAQNNLTDAGSRHIWSALEYSTCPLQRLVLRQCSLTSACSMYMTSALKNNKNLRSLDLSFNQLRDDGIILLCGALAEADCGLLILELEQCGFTSISCQALASMFCSHKNLRHLDISKNVIGIDGMMTLSLMVFNHRREQQVAL
ncbi:NACHT, LRR and PYD domains-containing protein 8 [Onychomys torridus]|uniref:NACHT, LRR and PYD domains-containing protein 8 n=1 Tax=Onychomys torridus TaxID=38674 RepID=UPI00167F47EF|nr:NACHT, LRR and PYD domains-containing protein 8 [Onychomys torridus]